MIQIMMLPNPEHFLSVVNHSQGDVFLQLPDRSRVNLKENAIAQQMLRLTAANPNGLLIDVTDRKDIPAFLRYLTEAVLEDASDIA